jgi:predicted alpha/beta-fold hydrolase
MPAASAVSLSKSLIGSKLYVPSFLSTMKAKALAANDDITSSDNNSNNSNSNSNDKHVSSNSVYLHGKSPELKQKTAAAVVDFEALKAVSSIDEFNRIYTVPEFGFQNTTEYVSFASHCLYLLYTACGT